MDDRLKYESKMLNLSYSGNYLYWIFFFQNLTVLERNVLECQLHFRHSV